MKSQILHTVLCNIAGEAAGELLDRSLLGVKGLNYLFGLLVVEHCSALCSFFKGLCGKPRNVNISMGRRNMIVNWDAPLNPDQKSCRFMMYKVTAIADRDNSTRVRCQTLHL